MRMQFNAGREGTADASKCTKEKIGTDGKTDGEEDESPFAHMDTILLPEDSVKGVCTYKAKRRKAKSQVEGSEPPVKLRMARSWTNQMLKDRGVQPSPFAKDDL
ncbi:unnamed protein product [Prorocentrum cordatum]|uniref:Uncharacterized protein n=1 Tax=Prorocentrum cordatum TaxID=2364126 RepID=A0ABN9Y4G1_9DINO|nr:unnamed protein product [Polarella glacialis]